MNIVNIEREIAGIWDRKNSSDIFKYINNVQLELFENHSLITNTWQFITHKSLEDGTSDFFIDNTTFEYKKYIGRTIRKNL